MIQDIQLKREGEFEDEAWHLAKQIIAESTAIGVPNDHIESWVIDFAIGLATRIAMWADRHPAWISVDECLPDEDEIVIIYTSNGSIAVSRYEGGEWVITNLLHAINVTHWMKLPNPPKK